MYYIEKKNPENSVAQRGGVCLILGNIPGQFEQGSERPDVVQDVHAHCRGVELDLPTQMILLFYLLYKL